MSRSQLAAVSIVLAVCVLACSQWRETLREGTYGPSSRPPSSART